MATAIVCVGLAAASFFEPSAWIGIAVAAVGSLGAAAWDYWRLRRMASDLTVALGLPTIVGRDALFHVVAVARNSGGTTLVGSVRAGLPAGAIPQVWIESFHLPAQTELEFRLSVRIPIRGLHTFGPVDARFAGPLRFLERQVHFPKTTSVKVYPEALVSRDDLTSAAAAEIRLLDMRTRARERGVGTEFDSLAEYRPGDDVRRIDWRATARRRRPVVRRFQIERHRDVVLLIDAGRLMGADAGKGAKIDCAVDAALMVARVALTHGDRCGVGVFDNEVLGYHPPVYGSAALRGIIDRLYAVQSRWSETDFSKMFATLQSRQQKRAMIIVISDVVDVETTRRFRASLAALAKRHIVAFAALRTPVLSETIHRPVDSLLEGARHAAAFRILHEREQALASLSRAGVHVLDVEPAQLTIPLIRQFVELRSRNLL
jgi:uncharacterized protein (DUF58 family)